MQKYIRNSGIIDSDDNEGLRKELRKCLKILNRQKMKL